MTAADRARRATRWTVMAVAACSISIVAAACGIDEQESAQPINPDALGGLDQTIPPSTDDLGSPVVPSSTVNPPASTTPASSDPGPTEPATMFYIEGPALAPVTVDVKAGLGLLELLQSLETGPPQAEAEAGLRTAIPPGLIVSVRAIADTVTVNFEPTLFQEIDGRDRPLVIGQVVLTVDAQGTPRVRFTLAGEPLPVLRRNGEFTEGTESVTANDYEQLIAADD